MLIGDGVHNGFDGVLIAAAFLTDVRLGILATIAITAHEIPQELGDLAVLLHAGMKPARALLFNTASSLTSIIGGLAGYYALAEHARGAALRDFSGRRLPDLCGRGRPDSRAFTGALIRPAARCRWC